MIQGKRSNSISAACAWAKQCCHWSAWNPLARRLMPIDGILGNNVWGELVVGIDYPANRITSLARDSSISQSMLKIDFDGQHLQYP